MIYLIIWICVSTILLNLAYSLALSIECNNKGFPLYKWYGFGILELNLLLSPPASIIKQLLMIKIFINLFIS